MPKIVSDETVSLKAVSNGSYYVGYTDECNRLKMLVQMDDEKWGFANLSGGFPAFIFKLKKNALEAAMKHYKVVASETFEDFLNEVKE